MKRKVIRLAVGFSVLLVIGIFWEFRGVDSVVHATRSAGVPETPQSGPGSTQGGRGEERRLADTDGRVATRPLTGAIDAANDPDRQSEMLENVVQNIPDSNLRSALDDLIGKETEGARLLRQLLVRRWAEADPPSAARWVGQHLDDVAYKEAIPQVAIAWAGVDTQAATGWAASLPETPVREQALLNIGYEVAGSQPAIALGIVSALPPGIDRDNLLNHTISQWASTDTQAASAWAEQIRDDALRQRLQGTLAVSVAEKDEAVAGALAANLAPGPDQDRAVIEIVQRWGQTAPTSAGTWIAAFPDTPLRQTALQALVGVWSVQDSTGAASWVRSLSAGSMREAGLAALADANLALPR